MQSKPITPNILKNCFKKVQVGNNMKNQDENIKPFRNPYLLLSLHSEIFCFASANLFSNLVII